MEKKDKRTMLCVYRFLFLKVVKVQAQYMYISTLNLFVLNEDKQV